MSMIQRGMTQRRTIAVIFAFSLLVRLAALGSFQPPPIDSSALVAYLGGAHKLVDGEGFSDPSYPVYAPPLYAMFIALCLSVFGDDLLPVKIVQAVVDSLTVVLVFLIMWEIFDIQVGLLSAAILAVYPFSIYLTISIASEPLFAFFLSGFVLFTVYAVRFQKSQYYCGAGILLGLATLTRATTQFVPLMFLIMLLPFRKTGRHLLLSYGAFCISFGLVILPWSVRNYSVLDDFIPVATGGGIVILMGSTEEFLTINGKSDMYRTHVPKETRKPSQIDKFWMRAGIERYKIRFQEDPVGSVAFMVNKFFRLWYATESGTNHKIILVSHLLIYIFALAGLVIALLRGKTLAWIPACVLFYFVVLHWFSLPLFRYMIPIMPYVIGFAAFAIITMKNEWHRVNPILS